MGCVDHHGLFLAMLGGQTGHDPGKDAAITPSLPSVAECLVRPVFPRGITPPQAIAIYENNPAQHTPVIYPWLAVELRETRRQTHPLRIPSRDIAAQCTVGQRVSQKRPDISPLRFRKVHHAQGMNSMGPDPKVGI
jgi:hypothetical protein